jgi:RimJ/RimL family protein N-acetyltransferase
MGTDNVMRQDNTIVTDRLILTPFCEDFLTERYVGWLNDEQLMQYSEQRHRTHTIDSCREYMRSFDNSPHYFWAIEKNEGVRRHIGNINSYIDTHNRLADIGILIGERDEQKRGYGLEAFTAVIDFLFSQHDIRKVTAGAMALNTPMIRLMKNAGMSEDGIRKKHYIWNNQETDILYFAIFRQESGKDRQEKER